MTTVLIILGIIVFYLFMIPICGVGLKIADNKLSEADYKITDQELIKWSCLWPVIISIVIIFVITEMLSSWFNLKEKYLRFINYFANKFEAREIRKEAREIRGLSRGMKK